MVSLKDFLATLNDIEINNMSLWPLWFRWLSVLFVCFAVLLGGYHFFISPKTSAINQLQPNESRLKEQFLMQREIAVSLPNHEEKTLKLERHLHGLLENFLQDNQTDLLLHDISQIAAVSELNIETMELGTVVIDDFYLMLPISIVATTSFQLLVDFFHKLSMLEKIVTVGDFEIYHGLQDEQLRIEMRLYAYQYVGNHSP